ncbi:uncharacterized protein LOC119678154 isoform X2 [Teleopsis dalmanni]|nr:uncharacterized protein LOC119678154 isoform X2 [Teleopsis dalmanni]
MPTAQLYYKEMLENIGESIPWDLMKFKMRHLRLRLQKTEHWRNTIGLQIKKERGDKTVREHILKICPHYDRLLQMFGNGDEIVGKRARKLLLSSIKPEEEERAEATPDLKIMNVEESYEVPHPSPKQIEFLTTSDIEITNIEESYRQCSSDTKLTDLHEMKELLKQERLKPETENFEMQYDLEIKKLKLDEERILLTTKTENRKLDLEERKLHLEERRLEKEFELKKMELEMKERLAKIELELKYKKAHC